MQHHATFESIRHVAEDGGEYWFARDLAPLLDYQDWRNFMQVVDKARVACAASGHQVADHFGDLTKMVEIGSGAKREVADVRLSRYACYLIVQNGDPSKPVIANGQTYFATQTEEKLKRDKVRGKQNANQTHFEVGKKVRQTIHELGGTMPETLPTPEASVKQIENAKKKLAKK